jgi:hypothetical protein
VNLNTLKDEKREDCFVEEEEEEAIVLLSILAPLLKPYTRHYPFTFRSELEFRAPARVQLFVY